MRQVDAGIGAIQPRICLRIILRELLAKAIEPHASFEMQSLITYQVQIDPC